MIQEDSQLVANLVLTKRYASFINNRILDFRARMPVIATTDDKTQERQLLELNNEIDADANKLVIVIDQAIDTLTTKYGLRNPLSPLPPPNLGPEDQQRKS